MGNGKSSRLHGRDQDGLALVKPPRRKYRRRSTEATSPTESYEISPQLTNHQHYRVQIPRL